MSLYSGIISLFYSHLVQYVRYKMWLLHYSLYIHGKIYPIEYATRSKGMSHMSANSILIFQYRSLVHLKYYILIQTPSQSDIWLQSYEQFFEFKSNVKHKNLSPLLACNSKSIFPTSDSFPLIMSHICKHTLTGTQSMHAIIYNSDFPTSVYFNLQHIPKSELVYFYRNE